MVYYFLSVYWSFEFSQLFKLPFSILKRFRFIFFFVIFCYCQVFWLTFAADVPDLLFLQSVKPFLFFSPSADSLLNFIFYHLFVPFFLFLFILDPLNMIKSFLLHFLSFDLINPSSSLFPVFFLIIELSDQRLGILFFLNHHLFGRIFCISLESNLSQLLFHNTKLNFYLFYFMASSFVAFINFVRVLFN